MTTKDPNLDRMKQLLGEIDDLRKASTLLFWDQRVMMPPGGAQARADALATVGRLTHERFVDPDLGTLLENLQGLEESLDYDSDDASLIRVTRRDYEKAVRVPPALTGEMRRASALALAAWGPAKEASDFEQLRPHLETLLELRQRYVACFDPPDETYDVLLDDYEPGMKTAEAREIFDRLKQDLRPLIEEIADAGDIDDSFLKGDFDAEAQRAFSLEVVRRFGFTDAEWRLDTTAHPFMTTPGHGDVRLTTNFRPHDLTSIFASMHEFGHGVYEWGVAPELARTPLANGASAALHESQSRMWENLVARGRPFWTYAYDDLQAALPEQLGDVELERFYRYVNRIRPSLVRVDADEITYNLHIVLRFELERHLLAGRLEVRDLPEAFDERMLSYLGLEVPDALHGVLQDIHWADVTLGYFPTYSLGNVMSVQIWERARADLDDLDAQLERGEFGELAEWLREHLHRHGRKLTPRETLLRAAGSEIDPEPYVRYLKGKLGEVAGVAVT